MSDDIKYLINKGRSRSPPTWITYLFLLLLFCFYVGLNFLGGYIFYLFERDTNKTATSLNLVANSNYIDEFVKKHDSLTVEEVKQFLKIHDQFKDGNERTTNGSSYLQELEASGMEVMVTEAEESGFTLERGFLLSFTISSTIGYGHITPRTMGGKLFAILFALVSIPFTCLLVYKLAMLMAYTIELLCETMLKRKQYDCVVKFLALFLMLVFGLILYVVIPSVVLSYAIYKESWPYVDSIYYVFLTLTTVGFGDVIIDTESAGLWADVVLLVWVVAGMSWLVSVATMIMTNYRNRMGSTVRAALH